MKCIKAIKQTKTYDLGEIRRTDDIDAEQKVKSGTFQYIPKSEWRGTKVSVKVNEVVNANEPTQELSIEQKKLKRKKNDKK